MFLIALRLQKLMKFFFFLNKKESRPHGWFSFCQNLYTEVYKMILLYQDTSKLTHVLVRVVILLSRMVSLLSVPLQQSLLDLALQVLFESQCIYLN